MENQQFKYIWLAAVALLGGVLGYARKYAIRDRDKTFFGKALSLILEISTSMFIAYITFELGTQITSNTNMCVALAGLASFAGTDALVVFEKMFLNLIRKWMEKI